MMYALIAIVPVPEILPLFLALEPSLRRKTVVAVNIGYEAAKFARDYDKTRHDLLHTSSSIRYRMELPILEGTISEISISFLDSCVDRVRAVVH